MFFRSKSNHLVTEDQVLRALSEIVDPDLNKNIVALGFVKNLKLKDGKVSFTLELTTAANARLKEEAASKVKAIPGVSSVDVQLSIRAPQQGAHAHPHPPGKQGPQRIQMPGVNNVIAIASGKGGVGKSTVTINLAMALAETGARVGLLDADIYGPSIPMMMGINRRPDMQGERVLPIEKDGVKMISMGFLVPVDQPVVWRGPMVHGALTQFMNQVEWGELDYLLIDMPPGTGDAQLTISQNAPLSGAIIVTTPQEVSLLDARRGLMMFQSVKVPILGIVENMAGYVCSHCHETTQIFREGGGEKISREMNVPLLGSIPLDPRLAEGSDTGRPMVQAHPDAEVTKIYRRIAGEITAQLTNLHFHNSGQFQPLTLTWQ